jgi:hypothetical protein
MRKSRARSIRDRMIMGFANEWRACGPRWAGALWPATCTGRDGLVGLGRSCPACCNATGKARASSISLGSAVLYSTYISKVGKAGTEGEPARSLLFFLAVLPCSSKPSNISEDIPCVARATSNEQRAIYITDSVRIMAPLHETAADIEAHDEEQLADWGYKQELKRDWGLMHNFGISFSIIVSAASI